MDSQVVRGNVLDCSLQVVKMNDGSEVKYYDSLVNFGNGAVRVTSGALIPLGVQSFIIVPKSRNDCSVKIRYVAPNK